MPKRHVGYGLDACPVEAAIEVLRGKWKGMVLFYLLDGPVRFSDLRRRMPSVTQRILTKGLRELEGDGLVVRTQHPGVPPPVDYALTERGRGLAPAIQALKIWGEALLVEREEEAA